jgi:hypothetical protein
MNCPACSRRTPIARATCQYCGAALEVASIQTAPSQRHIETFERAFNTILCPRQPAVDQLLESRLAAALSIELDEARALICAGKPLPLFRCQTANEAELVAGLVRTCGLAARVVHDVELKLETELPRARRITISDGEMTVAYAGGATELCVSRLKLIVVGRLKTQRTDYSESAKGLGKQTDVVDSYEYRSDGMLLDVYGENLGESFRILSDGFDYSGLVEILSLRTEVNFKTAIASLKKAAPALVVDDDFARVRRLLARAWPERTHTESKGIQRAGLALRPVARASAITDNRDQFGRYSRLMFLMN